MSESGRLFVVATPIGNLGDISRRAVEILGTVDLVAAEDTRHSKVLLDALGIKATLRAYHDFSSEAAAQKLLAELRAGRQVALISDAGTPLISDPGYKLVKQARAAGISVIPIPGASALVAALSVAGLPTDRFLFEGFLPARSSARCERLRELELVTSTLVLYESSHRIMACLEDLARVFGEQRQLFIGRELTKRFESHIHGSIARCMECLEQDDNQRKGEFVLVVAGCPESRVEEQRQCRALEIVAMLRGPLPLKQAVTIASSITGARKNPVYDAALKNEAEGE